MAQEITEETIIDVLDVDVSMFLKKETSSESIHFMKTQKPKGRVEILNELGYELKTCECCGQVTNQEAYDVALSNVHQILSRLLSQSRVSTTPEWKWLLSPSEV